MIYIIDANNLAGKMGLLPVKEFGQQLVEAVKSFFANKQTEVFLVFDSLEFMGDKTVDGYLTVVYSPRDSFYASADDKIVELVWRFAGIGQADVKDKQSFDTKEVGNQIVMVSDDLEIIAKTEDIQKKIGQNKIQIERASDFAVRMDARKRGRQLRKELIEDDERGLDEREVDKINQELLIFWKK